METVSNAPDRIKAKIKYIYKPWWEKAKDCINGWVEPHVEAEVDYVGFQN